MGSFSAAAPETDSSQSPSFSGVARKIRAWTTNLLATAIVLACGLAIGWQVTVWWRDQTRPPQLNAEVDAKLALLTQAREFRTRSGSLKVQQTAGSAEEAVAAMCSLCRQQAAATKSRKAGPGEAAFIAELVEQAPLEEAGALSLYQPKGQASMVVAVDRAQQRIASWCFAFPSADGLWSIYHLAPDSLHE
jgi:hypothetical protein